MMQLGFLDRLLNTRPEDFLRKQICLNPSLLSFLC